MLSVLNTIILKKRRKSKPTDSELPTLLQSAGSLVLSWWHLFSHTSCSGKHPNNYLMVIFLILSFYLKNKQQALKLTNNIQSGVDQLFFLNRLVNKNFVDELTNNFTSKVLLDSIRFFLERNQNYARVIHECIVTQSCPTLYDHMDRSPPGSSVYGSL